MKIKELEFLSRKEIGKLGKYAEMTIQEFVGDINDKIKKKVRINSFYNRLYNKISDMYEPTGDNAAAGGVTPEELRELADVPIEQIKFYVSNYSKAINKLKSEGISDMAGLLAFLPQNPAQVTARIIIEWKDVVISRRYEIAADWKDLITTRLLPAKYDEKAGFDENLRDAIVEYAALLRKRAYDKRFNDIAPKSAVLKAEILEYAYRDNLSDKEISRFLPQSHEHFRKIRTDTIKQMLSGQKLPSNAQLRPELYELACKLKERCIFHNLKLLARLSNSASPRFIPEMGFDTTAIAASEYIVPKGQKKTYDGLVAGILDALTKVVHPKETDELTDIIRKNPKVQEAGDFDAAIIGNILADTDIVDVLEDGRVQVKAEFLKSDRQRFSRIIYSAGKEITTEQIISQYISIYHSKPAAGPATSKEYGICCQSKRLWYYGEPRMQVERAIEKFALEHKTFHFSELTGYLEEKGYTILKSVRAPITKYCSVDNKDSDHFCHKDFTADFPQYSWRNSSIYGQSNWLLREVRDILVAEGRVETDALIGLLTERAKGTLYEDIMKKRAKTIIRKFSGKGLPLVEVNGMIEPNEPYFSDTDYELAGLRQIATKGWKK